MKSIFVFFIIVFFVGNGTAQKLDWIFLRSEYNEIEISYTTNSSKGGVVVASTDRVLSFSESGELKWENEYKSISGLASDKAGNIYILFFNENGNSDENEAVETVDEQQDSVSDDSEYTDEESDDSQNENELKVDDKYGYYIVTIDMLGHETSRVLTDLIPGSGIDVSEMKIHPNGSVVVCGWAVNGAIVTNNLGIMGPGGGDFVLMIGMDGKTKWVNPVSYISESCCTHVSKGCRLSFTPSGVIYLGGTYIDGAEFNNELVKMAPAKYETSDYADFNEAYIASYESDGKLKWVQTARCNSMLEALASSDNSISASFFVTNSNKIFDRKIDTISTQTNVLCQFDKNGAIRNINNARANISDVEYSESGNLIVLGINNIYIPYEDSLTKYWVIGKDSVTRDEPVFIAEINLQNEVLSFETVDIPMESEFFRMELGGNNQYFIMGELFCSLPEKLSLYDEAFGSAELYGSAGFVAKVRRSNK